MSKPEIRCMPNRIMSGGPVRLVGHVPGYTVVRRRGGSPFVVTRAEWDAMPPMTREQEAAFDHRAAREQYEAEIVADINRRLKRAGKVGA